MRTLNKTPSAWRAVRDNAFQKTSRQRMKTIKAISAKKIMNGIRLSAKRMIKSN